MWESRIKLEILAMGLDCREHRWDGYQAEPVTLESMAAAVRFVEALPFRLVDGDIYRPEWGSRNLLYHLGLLGALTPPEVSPDPGGMISLDWQNGKGEVLSLLFAPTREIIFAGVFEGKEKVHGSEVFLEGEVIPERILGYLKKHFCIERKGDE